MLSFDFTSSGKLESLFGTGFSFHFRHSIVIKLVLVSYFFFGLMNMVIRFPSNLGSCSTFPTCSRSWARRSKRISPFSLYKIDTTDKSINIKTFNFDGNNYSVETIDSHQINDNVDGVAPTDNKMLTAGEQVARVKARRVCKKTTGGCNSYEMEISGERALGKEPALWETIHVVFKLKGSMTKEKAEKACALSIDKYCSVAATLRAAGAVITWEVVIL